MTQFRILNGGVISSYTTLRFNDVEYLCIRVRVKGIAIFLKDGVLYSVKPSHVNHPDHGTELVDRYLSAEDGKLKLKSTSPEWVLHLFEAYKITT